MLITGRLLAKNTVLSLVAQIAPLIIAIVAIPILLDRLGLVRLGILSLVWVLLGYAGLLDLGIARALTQRTSRLLARHEEEGVAKLATTAIAANFGLGIVGGACLVALRDVLPVALGVPYDFRGDAEGAVSVLALGLPVALATSAVRGLIEGAQRFDLVTAVAAPTSTLTYALPAGGAVAGLSLPAIVGLLVAARVATFVAYLLLTRRAFPKLSVFGLPSWSAARGLLGYGGWLTVSSASAPAIVYGERAIIASATTASGLGLYAIPYELVARMWVVPGAIAATLFPAFAALNEIDINRVESTFRRSLTLLIVVLGPIAMLLVSLGGPLLHYWLGSDVASSMTLPLQIFAVGAVINSLGYLPLAYLQASGRAHLAAKLHLAEIPGTYLVTWALASQFGLVGAAVAWLARVTTDSAVLFVFASRSSREVALGARSNTLTIVILSLAILGAAVMSTVESLGLRTLGVALIVATTFALIWRLGLTASDRTTLSSLARHVWSSRVQPNADSSS
ncbi:MAG: flippase [Actinomycetota bacterium]|nr:flippase [Actinomycetota bacterium]